MERTIVMTQFPLAPVYVGKIESRPDEFQPFKQRLIQLLTSPAGMAQVSTAYPYRACRPLGQGEYRDGVSVNRLFQNAVLAELCCGVRYQIDPANRVQVTINRGGEYAFLDPAANAYLMIWVNETQKRIQYKIGPDGQRRFAVPSAGSLLPADAAEGFFDRQRRLAGCTATEMQAVRRDTRRAAAADALSFA